MKKQFISTFVILLFLLSISLTLFLSSAKAAAPKIQFQYILFPTSVFIDSVINAGVCFVNQGAAGQLIYDGTTNFDEVSISIPVGTGADKLILDSSVLSYNTSADWSCTIDTSGVTGGEGEFLLIFRPNDTQSIAEGETICFDISGLIINSEVGLALLHVDQQFDPSRSEKEKNGSIGVFKTADISGIVEIDPTVNEDVKDGVDFTEVTGMATDTQIPNDISIDHAADADTVDNKHYSDIADEIDADVAAHSDETSGIHGVSGEVVGTENNQTLTNKHISGDQIDSGKISNDRLNMGSGNGINADMVDSKHYSDISKEVDDKINSHENASGHLTIEQKTDLTGGGDTTLHYHGSDRNLANATGTLDISHLNAGQVQKRVTGTCGPGSSIREVREDGSVVCEPDDVNDAVSNPSGSYPSMNVGSVDGRTFEVWRICCQNCDYNAGSDPGDWDLVCFNVPSDFTEESCRRLVCERHIWGWEPGHCKNYLYNSINMDGSFNQTAGLCPGF